MITKWDAVCSRVCCRSRPPVPRVTPSRLRVGLQSCDRAPSARTPVCAACQRRRLAAADRAARRLDFRRPPIRHDAKRLDRPRARAPESQPRAVARGHRYLVPGRARPACGHAGTDYVGRRVDPLPRGCPWRGRSRDHNRATEALPARCLELAKACQLTLARVSVRNQRSRWGACSTRRVITLNWRLWQMPPSVTDYVIFHELMHLKQPNHSRRFWREVDAVCAWWREAERWLRKHGRELL